MRRLGVLLTIVLLLGGCVGSQKVANEQAISPLRVLPVVVPAGGLVRVDLLPSGTREAVPVMVLDVAILDGVTGRPVLGDLYVVEGEAWRLPGESDLVAADVSGLALALPGEFTGWVVVEAAGFVRWEMRLSWRVWTSRELGMPVRLARSEGGT
jgi:hypothetical protein